MRFPRLLRCALGLALLAARASSAGAPAVTEPSTAAPIELAERHAQWLEEVDVILSLEERDAFLALTRNYQRDAFIERFWHEHDSDSYTARNEFRERWQEKVEQVGLLFGSLRDIRSRYFLLHGPPDPRALILCQRHAAQIEVWFYPHGSDAERTPFPLFFYRPQGDAPELRLWEPGDDSPETACAAGTLSIDEQFILRDGFKLLETYWGGFAYPVLLAKARERPPVPDREWVATFQSLSTDLPAGVAPLPATLSMRYGGRRQSRVLVEGEIVVDPDTLPTAAEPALAREPQARHFLLNGEVVAADRLFESFRVQYAPPAPPGPPQPVALEFVRALRPGHYTLVVRVEEPGPGRFFRTEQALDVAAPAIPQTEGASVDAPTDEALSLHLLAPTGILRGRVRFDADVRGSGVAAVEFLLDGKRILLKRSPPWSVELDLGAAARTRRVEAVGLDASGAELLRDQRLVNSSDYRFAVRLLEPRAGVATKPGARLRVRAEVMVPAGAAIERLEISLDEALIGTLYGEPWELPLALPADSALHVLRAAAVLADGSSAESSVLLNAPEGSATIDVRMVELFAGVRGRDGRIVHGLGCADFHLREDGVEQQLLRCEEAAERTLHLGVLLDASASMAERLPDAKKAADRFLTSLLRPRDRATLVAFNNFTNRLVPFTNALPTLRSGLDGLKAERGTALWDAVVRTLQDFAGVEGRRALLLLSDGDDQASTSTFTEALALARQGGVRLYAVGLDLPFGESRHRLRKLSEETGGRAFFVHDSSELDEVYARIADELRSQYLLAYQPQRGGERAGDAFRTVEVEVRRSGVEVEAPAGYQP